MRSYTYQKAKEEFSYMRKNEPGAIVLEFEKEILELVDKFGNSGQSGGSAPYVCSIISNVVQNLCMHQPIMENILPNSNWSWDDLANELIKNYGDEVSELIYLLVENYPNTRYGSKEDFVSEITKQAINALKVSRL